MKEKRYGLLAVIVIALIGLGLIIFGFILGGRPGTFYDSDGDLVYQTSSESFYVGDTLRWLRVFNIRNYTSSEYSSYDSDYTTLYSGEHMDISGYKSYYINVDYGSVTITGGDTASITVYGDMAANVTVDEDTLYISSESNDDWSNWSNWAQEDGDTRKITITLPSTLADLNAYLDVGKMSISDLSVEYFDFYVSTGAATVSNVNTNYSAVDVDTGSINLEEFYAQSMNLTCDTGSIILNGNIKNNLSANCSVGNISVSMPEPENYYYDLNCSSGDLSLGNIKLYDGPESKESSSSNAMYYNLNCDLGKLSVVFK